MRDRRLLALVTMARPPVGLFSAGAALLTFHAAGGDLALSRAAPILGSVFAITSGGFVINDYFDREKDRRNSVDRPLPQRLVSPRAARSEAMALFAGGLVAAVFLGPALLALAAANTLLLVAYSPAVKRAHGALANLAVAYLSASALLFGALVAGKPASAVPAMLFIFGITLAREVVFDVADAHGDRLSGLTTLPVAYGAAAAFRIAWLTLAATAAAAAAAAVLGRVRSPALFLVASAAALAVLATGLSRYQRQRSEGSYVRFGVVASHFSFAICGVVIYSGRLSSAEAGAGAGLVPTFTGWSDGYLLGGVLALLLVTSLTLSRYNK